MTATLAGRADLRVAGRSSRTWLVGGTAAIALTAGCGSVALGSFQGSAAPAALPAAGVAAAIGFAVICAAEWRAGATGARIATAMGLLTTLGWIIQSRAPISVSAGGGSTQASSVALRGTPIWAAVASLAFLVVLAGGRRLTDLPALGGVLGGAAVVGLLLVPFVPGLGVTQNGVRGWVHLGPVSAQPGELGRVLLVLFLAAHLESRTVTLDLPGSSALARRLRLGSTVDLLRTFGVVVGALVLLLVQQDLGPAILVVIIAGGIAWAATGRAVYPALAVGGFLAGIGLLLPFSPKVSGRVTAWLHPFGHSGLATVNGVALEAQARGGVLGRGLGRGFDPYWVAARNDYIVPQVALRLGLVGLLCIVMLVVVIVGGLLDLARSSDGRGRLIACGAAISIGGQALLIAAGSTSAFPLTGVAFPFVSYGGTSLVASSVLVAFALGRGLHPDDRSVAPHRGVPVVAAIGLVMALLAMGVVAKSVTTATSDAGALARRRDNPWNHQPVSLERGRILSADHVVLADSVRRGGRWYREYPLGAAGSGVVGWVSRSGSMGGAELAFDARLSHQHDVTLTIDARQQVAAYRALGGRIGAVVVLGRVDGAVRVLVSSPGFDPVPLANPDPKAAAAAMTRLVDDPAQPLLSLAYQQRFAPGSTFKLVTAFAGLEHGVSATERFPVLRRWSPPGGSAIANDGGERCGGTVARMLTVSCNTTALQVGVAVGADGLRRAAADLGLAASPTLGLPRAAGATLPAPAASPFRAALAAIGQGDVSISPLQQAMVAGGAAYGTVLEPHILPGRPRRVAAPGEPPDVRRIIDEGMAGCIRVGTCQGLRATSAVYAKTGTAEAGRWTNAWIDVAEPDLSMTVLVRGPASEGITGATAAVPVAVSTLICCGSATGAAHAGH